MRRNFHAYLHKQINHCLYSVNVFKQSVFNDTGHIYNWVYIHVFSVLLFKRVTHIKTVNAKYIFNIKPWVPKSLVLELFYYFRTLAVAPQNGYSVSVSINSKGLCCGRASLKLSWLNYSKKGGGLNRKKKVPPRFGCSIDK